jgi:uncharacterized protein (DUF1499 family)
MTKRARFARIALVLSLAAMAWFAIAMFGAKLGLWTPITAFGTLTMVPALPLLGLTGVLGAAALVATLLRAPRQGWIAALVALALPLAGFGWLASLKAKAESVPFIYDVTTDTADPPTYSQALMNERADYGANALNPFDAPLGQFDKWKGNAAVADKTTAQLIAEGYPALKPLVVEAEPAAALAAAEQAMQTRGFHDITLDEKAGRAEGTDEVFWYSFLDDIVVRVRPGADGGSVIDVRSTSRVGTSDLGVNARRAADLLQGIQDILANPSLVVEDREL